MRILLCGADGFLGRHFEAALTAAGHQVVRGVRKPKGPLDIAMDYRRDLAQDVWLPRLAGIDAVINGVGILNERQPEDFEHIHHQAPAALFAACACAGVGKVIQISALGAEKRSTPYLASKAAADDALLSHCPRGVVLRPALVFGLDGISSRFFLTLASLPMILLPGGGRQPVRPIHIDDLAALVVRLLDGPLPAGRVVEAVGGRELGFGQMLAVYRRGLGFPPALAPSLPAPVMGGMARLGDWFPGSLLNSASWAMLNAGNSADPSGVAKILGRPPRPAEAFIPAEMAGPAARQALATWRMPLLRMTLAFLWFWSAAVSLLWPETGLALLAPFGLGGAGATLVLLGASLLDACFGWLSLSRPGRRLWQAQMLLILVYSLLVAIWLPEFITHPFAPIAKNLVVLVLPFQLWAEESNP